MSDQSLGIREALPYLRRPVRQVLRGGGLLRDGSHRGAGRRGGGGPMLLMTSSELIEFMEATPPEEWPYPPARGCAYSGKTGENIKGWHIFVVREFLARMDAPAEPPCPDCGGGMEVQHVCENCGKREAI